MSSVFVFISWSVLHMAPIFLLIKSVATVAPTGSLEIIIKIKLEDNSSISLGL